MKIIWVLAIAFLIALVQSPSCMAFYLTSGYLTEDLVLSSPLAKGIYLSGNIEYFSASGFQIATPGLDKPKFGSPSDAGINSLTALVIPLKVAVRLADDLSLRLTLPCVSLNQDNADAKDRAASGIGDARVEGLYELMNETKHLPSICLNVGVKLATGKYKDINSNELALGTGATDFFVSAIASKRTGPLTCKALVGEAVMGATETTVTAPSIPTGTVITFDPPDELIYSLAIIYSVDQRFELGGEVYGASAGRERWKVLGVKFNVKHSEINDLFLSPYVCYKPNADSALKISIDYPLSQQPTFAEANNGVNWVKGTNIIIGGSWKI